jgi:hypothetical protein
VKDLSDYDMIENKYFPELNDAQNINLKNKYGILNLGLIRNDKVITGYQWSYSYWDGEKLRYIHSYDLLQLRQKVESKELDWIIIDNALAIDTYKFNNELLKKHKEYLKKNKGARKYRGSSGVSYVTIQKDSRSNAKKYWRYLYNGLNICDTDLKSLMEKVLDAGGVWIVRDKDLLKKNLENGLK